MCKFEVLTSILRDIVYNALEKRLHCATLGAGGEEPASYCTVIGIRAHDPPILRILQLIYLNYTSRSAVRYWIHIQLICDTNLNPALLKRILNSL